MTFGFEGRGTGWIYSHGGKTSRGKPPRVDRAQQLGSRKETLDYLHIAVNGVNESLAKVKENAEQGSIAIVLDSPAWYTFELVAGETKINGELNSTGRDAPCATAMANLECLHSMIIKKFETK